MDMEVFAVFNRLECMAAVWALEFEGRNNRFTIDKGLSADFALGLVGFSVVAVEIRLGSLTAEVAAVLRDITGFPSGNRLDLLVIA